MPEGRQPDKRRWKRLGWFVLIWLCSVAALGLAAFAMRTLMRLAGLASP
jgi:hypothetical protein